MPAGGLRDAVGAPQHALARRQPPEEAAALQQGRQHCPLPRLWQPQVWVVPCMVQESSTCGCVVFDRHKE